jgi:hypothetical protein
VNIDQVMTQIKDAGLAHDALTAAKSFDYSGLVYIVRIALKADPFFVMTIDQVDDLAEILRLDAEWEEYQAQQDFMYEERVRNSYAARGLHNIY